MFNFIKKGVAATEHVRSKTDKDTQKRKKDNRSGGGGGSIGGIGVGGGSVGAGSSLGSDEFRLVDDVRQSVKDRVRRKDKEKLPSGITADYSADFFASLNLNKTPTHSHHENGNNTSIHYENITITNISYSDSSETSLHSVGNLKFNNGTPNMDTIMLNSTSPSTDSSSDFTTPQRSASPTGEAQGNNKWPRCRVFDGLNLPLPPINLIELPAPRDLLIKRQKSPRNDFGFSLRNAIRIERPSLDAGGGPASLKPTIFAEPGSCATDITGLLPGDRLISVNKDSVENVSREVIIEMIRNCKDQVLVRVQPVSELVELSRRCMDSATISSNLDGTQQISNANTLRRSATKRKHDNIKLQNSTNQQRIWLLHRDGFCAATRKSIELNCTTSSVGSVSVIVGGGGGGAGGNNGLDEKITITLVHSEESLVVEADDIENANPLSFDLCEDICQLQQLNESSILHCLRQRFASNLIHTKAGKILTIINPMAPLSLYSEKVAALFRGCKADDVPPHIYSLAQSAYKNMLDTRTDQSILFMGRSNSGKTTNFRHALYYLTIISGGLSTKKILTVEKVNAINTILESFGNVRTDLNSNSTMFTTIFSLNYDYSGVIASASVQVLLLERSRAGRRSSKKNGFHILPRLYSGADRMLQKDLLFEDGINDETNLFLSIPRKLEEKQKLSNDFSNLVQAFNVLKIDDVAVKGIWMILAAIIHLGYAGVVKENTGHVQFGKSSSANRAAYLLGTSIEHLTSTIFSQGESSPSTINSIEAAVDSLEGFVIGLYSEVVSIIVTLVNKTIRPNTNTVSSILLIDTPGFQNPTISGGASQPATLSDLSHNYLHERLHLLFHHNNLVAPINRYRQELVEINFEYDAGNPGALAALIDKTPQKRIAALQQQQQQQETLTVNGGISLSSGSSNGSVVNGNSGSMGIFWLLDEESMSDGSSDNKFYDRLMDRLVIGGSNSGGSGGGGGGSGGSGTNGGLIRKTSERGEFYIEHLQGTNPVLYSVAGWLKFNREHKSISMAKQILCDSTKYEIKKLFSGCRNNGFWSTIGPSETTQSRISSIKRQIASTGNIKKSLMLQVKFTIDGLIDTIRRTSTHFAYCLLSQHAGTASMNIKNQNIQDVVNVPLLRSQLRGSYILDASRLYRQGFPESMSHLEFIQRFGLLANDIETDNKLNKIEHILFKNEIDVSSYRIGPSQVLLKCGILTQLEAKRDEVLTDRIVLFQAICRGYISRKQIAKKRVQLLAVRCIQRNVRVYLSIKDWSWWRLLLRITPLLNLNRTEEQMKLIQEELDVVKKKLEKYETERVELKSDNELLQIKLSDVTVDLNDERSTSNIVNERLNTETKERLKLVKELKLQETKFRELKELTDNLERDLITSESINELVSSNDNNIEHDKNSGTFYQTKYEQLAKELVLTKKKLQIQHEQDISQLEAQFDKKLKAASESLEDNRNVLDEWKRKMQKRSDEMNDLRMLLDQQSGRNNLLENRQRKFDVEIQALQDAKDRILREKEMLMTEKFSLEQQLSDAQLDAELKYEQIKSLQKEVEEISFSAGTQEDVGALQKQKIELDRKCKDQEEEMDEMAGQIQILEQAKLRLEITLETVRKERRLEVQQKDDEIEEIRRSYIKKMKGLEEELEMEHGERTVLLREKHELDRQISNLEQEEQSERMNEESAKLKLRKDVRKYKALLKDAQLEINRCKKDAPNKLLIRQLRNQIEDIEASKITLAKSKQTLEGELCDLQIVLDQSIAARKDAETKAIQNYREKDELQTQIEENEEELSELMKKYAAAVNQLTVEQTTVNEYEMKLSDVELEKCSLKDQVSELTSRLENMENLNETSVRISEKRLALKVKELESKLELEQVTRARVEVQCNRHKELVEKVQSELLQCKSKDSQSQESTKKLHKSLRDIREELNLMSSREQDNNIKLQECNKKVDSKDAELVAVKNDLRVALQRISDLQSAMDDDDGASSESLHHSSDETLSDEDDDDHHHNINNDK